MCVYNCVPFLQLPTLLVLYWELQIRYPSVAMTVVNCALSAIQHTEEEEGRLKLLETFSEKHAGGSEWTAADGCSQHAHLVRP